uniref:Peripheral subunit-binding (PSBD) domain-containing protein n=1 Tax=Acrobeloides nanus TaxID=290746 RepID=A0A914DPG6_9BILA
MSMSMISVRYLSSIPAELNLAGPAVKLILQQYQVELSKIKPSGPKKNLLKSDVLKYISSEKIPKKELKMSEIVEAPKKSAVSPSKVATSAKYIDIPITNMRATIAKRLTNSKQSIPHSYASVSISADNLLNLRKLYAKEGIKVSVNDFIIKAAALSLKAVSEINVQWKNDSVVHMPNVDVSVAVATPSGLITPIVFGADRLQIEQISSTVRELSSKARENKLKPQEFQGGTFTISNLGMYGISHFTAIINPPQTAIAAIGGLNLTLDEDLKPTNQFMITLCYDNRAIQATDAQRFLSHLESLLSTPETMLLGLQQPLEISYDL